MLDLYINQLIEYAISSGLIDEDERYYSINRILQIFDKTSFTDPKVEGIPSLDVILTNLIQEAIKDGLVSDSITEQDLFDTKVMDAVTPRPREVIATFNSLYHFSPKTATDYFYKFSFDTNYIRQDRIVRDIKWVTKSQYGDIDITINLSKPEKDPKAIAAGKNAKSTNYPKCPLCIENVGFAGSLTQAARENHRIIPLLLDSEKWAMQYSPYVYYPEHCIVLNQKHQPMKINEGTFRKLLSFVKIFPHYFLGSNADLPIVGGSILSHDHFQGGGYMLPMAKATERFEFELSQFTAIDFSVLNWPVSVIRLRSENCDSLIEAATHILNSWRSYTDEEAFIYAETNGERHNTITPIARYQNDKFELDLALRNNITTDARPLGVYHPREEYWHIKKENIGLIEVMGLAVLPRRLKEEMSLVKSRILSGFPLADDPSIEKHALWVSSFIDNYSKIDETNIDSIIEEEVGKVFVKVLEDAGIYKNNSKGDEAFNRFIKTL